MNPDRLSPSCLHHRIAARNPGRRGPSLIPATAGTAAPRQPAGGDHHGEGNPDEDISIAP